MYLLGLGNTRNATLSISNVDLKFIESEETSIPRKGPT